MLRQLERALAYAQGKGFGAKTCVAEVAAIRRIAGQRLAGEPIIVDVGANIGNWTAAALRTWPNGRYVLFDPSTKNCAHLRERFAGSANITVEQLALSDAAGNAPLFSDVEGSGIASLHQRRLDHFGIDHKPIETVAISTLDAYCKSHAITHIDILKLDVEGHELHVLRGGKQILAHTRAVQFEFGGCNIDSRTYFQDFYYLFTECGFSLHRITPFGTAQITHYREMDETFVTTNYLAVHG